MTTGQFSTGSIVKYALLPRILPRMGELFLSGFAQVAYLMAQVYRGVRLLPENHPYLLSANIGKFNMRQVIAAAANNLSFKRENIDQIIVFFAILMGMILLVAQGVLLLTSFFIPLAAAGTPAPGGNMLLSFNTYFGTQPNPAQDLAFILLDRIFGVPGIFNSCVSTGVPCAGTLPDLTFDTVNTIYAPPAANFPWPYHLGLHALLQFYSVGLLVVAAFIILYFVIVIIAETAQTGTPFGKRFNSVWAPLRLVIALGLLIPITSGLNSAQYITLHLAKFGSNFATNGWYWFNRGMNAWGAPQAIQLVAKPQSPEVDGLLQFMMLAHACKALEEGYITPPRPVATPAAGAGAGTGTTSNCGDLDQSDDGIPNAGAGPHEPENIVDGYLVKFNLSSSGAGTGPGAGTGTLNTDAVRLVNTNWDEARKFFDNNDMVIRFGDRSCENTTQLGRVAPTCGEIVIPVVNPSVDSSEVGSSVLQAAYYETVRYLWGDYGDNTALARRWRKLEFCDVTNTNNRFVTNAVSGDMELRKKSIAFVQHAICWYGPHRREYIGDNSAYMLSEGDLLDKPDKNWAVNATQHYKEGEGAGMKQFPDMVDGNSNYATSSQIYSPYNMNITVGGTGTTGSGTTFYVNMIAENAVRTAVLTQIDRISRGDFELPMDHLSRGWAGAGMWYNHIARMNGSLTGAAWNYPISSRYPQIMESVLAELRQNNQNMTPADQFNPNLGGRASISLQRANETESASILNQIYGEWTSNKSIHKPPSGNAIIDMVNMLFGTKGLFELSDPQNAQANPLALLSSLGKSLVETSIRNIAGATTGMVAGAVMAMSKFPVGEQTADTISTILFAISTSTLTAGITLYYILPFMPFIYFFFAVGNWVKGIFEAMVGVPLWALAHIRIDGNGLPGEAAMNGYYMLFEIFLRPILILFGLMASVTLFAAMATVLNGIWPLATRNVAGTNYDMKANAGWVESARGPIDQLFFTVMYAVVLYIMALSSFKLIDLIPSQMLRWLGTGVSTFSDMTGDAAAQLSSTAQGVTGKATSTAIGGLKSVGGGMKSVGNAVANSANNGP